MKEPLAPPERGRWLQTLYSNNADVVVWNAMGEFNRSTEEVRYFFGRSTCLVDDSLYDISQ